MTTTAPNKLDHVVGHNPFAIWRLKKKKSIQTRIEQSKSICTQFFHKFYLQQGETGTYTCDYHSELISLLPTNIPRRLKVVKYTTKKMGRCKTNVWSPCNTASQYFNDYTCHSHNWIFLRLLHIYEFCIFVVFFQLYTAFSSTNKSSQFFQFLEDFFSQKKKKTT